MESVCGYQASVLLLYCVDTNRMGDLASHLGQPYAMDPAWMCTTGAVDTVMAAQTAAIAARSLGLDYLFTNGIHRGDPQRVFTTLELPERDCLPLVALLLGYSAKERGPRKGRWCGPGIIHHGRYQRLTRDERNAQVAAYDDPHQNLGLNQVWRDKGCAHYLEFLFTQWCRPFDAGKQPPSAMTTILRRQGFIHAAPVA